MEILWRSLGALAAVGGFGIVLHVPAKFLLWGGIDGAIGWAVYLMIEKASGSMVFGTFMGAVIISVLAHIFARIFKTPVTMFVIPANLTLVPGAGMYRIVYSMINSNRTLTGFYFQQTFLAAGAIAAAIFIVNIVMGSILNGISFTKDNIKR